MTHNVDVIYVNNNSVHASKDQNAHVHKAKDNEVILNVVIIKSQSYRSGNQASKAMRNILCNRKILFSHGCRLC